MEILSGFVAGIISGMGMGGGVILILCLTLFLGIDQKIAQATNLIFFIPTCIAAIYTNLKNKKINFKIVKTVIITGVLGAIAGTLIAQKIEIKFLKKIFGIFLMIITVHEIYRIMKEYKILKKNNNIIKRTNYN